MEKKLTLGLLFGGRSTEHEVSVITALQVYKNLDKKRYQVVPVYISKSGEFYTNPKFLQLASFKDINYLLLSSTPVTFITKDGKGGLYLLSFIKKFVPLDIVFPALHGSFGEDGALQGVFETYQIPYVGFGILGSSIGMDKLASKLFFQSLGLPTGKYMAIKRLEWQNNQKQALEQTKKLKLPLFVKPATIGSSIGVNKATTPDSLSFAIEVAAVYSEKILVEEAFENVIEINCSALGYQSDVKASVCEQPVLSSALLSFKDKYQRGGGKGDKSSSMASMTRIIPAPISRSLTKEIQETTIKIFKALDGCGVARVDYFVDPKLERFWVNEINTMPGSLSFYLWKPKGIVFMKLLDMLIQFAIERAEDQKQTQYTFEGGLLAQIGQAGLKK